MKTFKQFLDEGVNDPNIFKVIFLAGGPGSGKGYVADRTTGGHGLVTSNADDLFRLGMDKAGLSLKMPDSETVPRDLVRSRSSELTKKRLLMWIKGRLGLIIDGTGHDVKRIDAHRKKMQALGYDTSMIFVNTSLEVAKARNLDRERTVPEDVLVERWEKVQRNLGKFQRLFGPSNFIVVDNNKAGDGDLEKVWLVVRRLMVKPVKNPKAVAWIKAEKEKAKRT